MQKRAQQVLNDPALKRQMGQLDAGGWVHPTSQKRAEDTRDKLIEAAEAVFAESGYTGARINDIAERAGVSPASVYVRFKDKDGLFNAVLDRFRAQIGDVLEHFFDGPGLDGVDTETVIHATVLDNAHKLSRNAGIMRATLQRGLSEPEIMARYHRMRQTITDHVAAFIAKRDPAADKEALHARVADAFDTIYGALITRIILQGDRSDPLAFATYLGELVTPHILSARQGN